MHLSPRRHAGLVVRCNALFIWYIINPTYFFLMINLKKKNRTLVSRRQHNSEQLIVEERMPDVIVH